MENSQNGVEPYKAIMMGSLAIGAIKQAIGSVPVIGGMILGMLDGIEKIRADEMMKAFSARIESLEKSKIDVAMIKSEEFLDLFCQAIRVRTRHRSQQKAKFIVGLLTDSIKVERLARFGIEIKETFLMLLDQLSDGELQFLCDFAKGDYEGKSKVNIYQSADKPQAIALDLLLSKGILTEDWTWEKNIKASELGQEFIAYLKHLANEN